MIRKRLFGLEPWEQLPKSAYADAVSEQVFEHMADRALTLLRADRASSSRRRVRPALGAERLRGGGAARGRTLHRLWLQAASNVCLRRVMDRVGDASDANAKVVMQQEAMDMGTVDWIKLDACLERAEIAAVARRCLEGG